ncbi:MAG: hypothetical protein PHQ61_02040 [Candidatus Omnitrophica bacterium]|nr:hypothetical protein [Candidatus Omnitrophota bacterium]
MLGIALVLLSALLYGLHYLIFHDAHHIYIYLLGDIAFVPVEVLIVTLIIHRFLSSREKRIFLEKLNMLIGVFFSEIGTDLIRTFAAMDPDVHKLRAKLQIDTDWPDDKWERIELFLRNYGYSIEPDVAGFERARDILKVKQFLLLELLANPNLLEHDKFTGLLWGVFHLMGESMARPSFEALPKADMEHIAGDIKRAYALLVHQWLDYMRHLKKNYPYLFSLAVRTNPFDPDASPVIEG